VDLVAVTVAAYAMARAARTVPPTGRRPTAARAI
jgi:hypothetical protein